MAQVYNFSSGPAMLPADVLRVAQEELRDWQGLGTSVMEISHRSKEFIQVAEQAEQDFRDLLEIPSNYKVLFCHGGVAAMDKINQQKADLLYGVIDNSDFYRNDVAAANRSRMNVPFQLADSSLDKLFLEESFAAGLHALKGHRVVGGMRASIYNAMPLEGVKALTDFMVDFERRHG